MKYLLLLNDADQKPLEWLLSNQTLETQLALPPMIILSGHLAETTAIITRGNYVYYTCDRNIIIDVVGPEYQVQILPDIPVEANELESIYDIVIANGFSFPSRAEKEKIVFPVLGSYSNDPDNSNRFFYRIIYVGVI